MVAWPIVGGPCMTNPLLNFLAVGDQNYDLHHHYHCALVLCYRAPLAMGLLKPF